MRELGTESELNQGDDKQEYVAIYGWFYLSLASTRKKLVVEFSLRREARTHPVVPT